MVCTNPYPLKRINPHWDGSDLLTKYTHVFVPCGKCLACRINRRREWTLRLQNEQVYSKSSFFVTLTYDDEHLPKDDNGRPCVSKRDVQLFLARLRKKFGDGIRYFINSEYGPETFRPHYHAIFFNLPPDLPLQSRPIVRFWRGKKSIAYLNEDLTKCWKNGDVEFSDVTKERCGYCAKYFVSRQDVPKNSIPNFSLISKGRYSVDGVGGIGYRYAKDIAPKVRYLGSTSCISPSSGHYVALPRYYRNNIYTEEERKQKFDNYLENYKVDEHTLRMIENRELVESAQLRAMTFKNIKSKL